MPYVICNDDFYLHQNNGGYSMVTDIEKATKWKKIGSANNVHKTLQNNEKYNGFAVRYVSKENNKVSEVVAYAELDYDIVDKANEIASLARQAEHRRAYLLEKIQMVDLEIVDIEHAAEFYNLNASQGYKLYKMLHDARIRRRELKNELEKINMFLSSTISSDKMENLKKNIIGLDNKQYTPRVNKELFGV